MLEHDDVVRISRVVLHAQHQPGDFVEGIIRLPADIRPVGRIGVHVDVIAIFNAQVFGRLRVHVQLVVAHARQPFVHPIRVAKVANPG